MHPSILSAGLGASLLFFSMAAHAQAQASERLPLFDAHMHYNVEARSLLSPQDVIGLWRKEGVKGVLATSRPNQGTLDLMATLQKESARDIAIVPFLRPYRVQPDRHDWFKNPEIEQFIETELKRGFYRGIGEFHLFGKDADSPQVVRMARMAQERGLWLHAHSDDDAIERLIRHAPKARIIWAHTGMSTPLDKVDRMFAAHPQLVGELSYRDIEGAGGLNAGWKALLLKYPDRFVIGTDTWVTPRWSEVGSLLAGYRRALADLPPPVAEKIAWRNAWSMFNLP